MPLPALHPYTCHTDRATHDDPTTAHTAPEADLMLAVRPPVLKRLGRHHLCHGQVAGCGLQVLPQRENVNAAVLEVKHGVDDLILCGWWVGGGGVTAWGSV
jgi:hypothetical protein